MRIWTLHPKCLDATGLVALWREGLLAQAVLRGQTRGYRHHPQLIRFRDQRSPLGCIAEYLRAVHAEARQRGYDFDAARIGRARFDNRIAVTHGQLLYEWDHLIAKLCKRDPARGERLQRSRPAPHPIFRVVPGKVEEWERR